MEAAELRCYEVTPGIDLAKLKRQYRFITMRGEELAIRVTIYNDDRSKKTLLMTHGYCMASVYFAKLLPALAEHYRIVMFDNLGWGLNSRTMEVGDALESAAKAEEYLVEWWHSLITELGDDLPPKFYLSGHSAGGAMSMLYAIHHPERIEGLFLQSPACIEDLTDQVYDPYTVRLSDAEDVCPSRAEADKMIASFANNAHI